MRSGLGFQKITFGSDNSIASYSFVNDHSISVMLKQKKRW